ncbi:MAG: ribosome silencing factor [Phycisphaerae bacterium]|nr:ribosome silencing factor [Phycisphaerae bacterium]
MAKAAPKSKKASPKPAPRMVATKTGLPTRSRPKAPTKASAKSAGKRDSALLLAKAAAKSLEGNKCLDVLILDLRGRSPITDYFVLATGTSDRQLHSAAEHVVELAESMNESLYRSNLDEKRAEWIVLDFVDVVVHTLMPDARRHYDLEMLWGDAPRVAWKKEKAKPEAPAKRNRAGLKQSDILPGRPRK